MPGCRCSICGKENIKKNCRRCNATGKDIKFLWIKGTCKNCNGKGFIPVCPDETNHRKDTWERIRRIGMMSSTTYCTLCNGKGVMSDEPDFISAHPALVNSLGGYKTCPKCGGRRY